MNKQKSKQKNRNKITDTENNFVVAIERNVAGGFLKKGLSCTNWR